MLKGKANICVNLKLYYDGAGAIVTSLGTAVKKILKAKVCDEHDCPLMLDIN